MTFQPFALSAANFFDSASDVFCAVFGRSELISACSNHGNAARAGQRGPSHPECRRLPPAPEPAALPNITPPQSVSGICPASRKITD